MNTMQVRTQQAERESMYVRVCRLPTDGCLRDMANITAKGSAICVCECVCPRLPLQPLPWPFLPADGSVAGLLQAVEQARCHCCEQSGAGATAVITARCGGAHPATTASHTHTCSTHVTEDRYDKHPCIPCSCRVDATHSGRCAGFATDQQPAPQQAMPFLQHAAIYNVRA